MGFDPRGNPKAEPSILHLPSRGGIVEFDRSGMVYGVNCVSPSLQSDSPERTVSTRAIAMDRVGPHSIETPKPA